MLNKNLTIPTAIELLTAFKNKSTWKSKTPLQKWCHFYGIGKLAATFGKLTFYVDDPSLYWVSYIPLVFGLLFEFGFIHSKLKKYIFKMMTMFWFSYVLAAYWSTYQFIADGIHSTITQDKFPFVNENSKAEFLGNCILQLVISIHGLFIYGAVEIYVDIFTDFILV